VPNVQPHRNPFLLELLSLQQDGRQAISAPTNWTLSKPLLEVATELDNKIDELSRECLRGASNQVGRWHFFIGSPGNGKSAAVGQVVRKLLNNANCHIVDEAGNDINQLPIESVPYSLDVFERGQNFSSLQIVQDASVVRNPYSADVDPARDLLDTMQAAWNRGISLIVCTNRGVLEKAFRDTYLNSEFNLQIWHRSILRKLIESSDGMPFSETPLQSVGDRPVFASIRPSISFLDKRSLILGKRGTFDELIRRAVEPEKWNACVGCPSNSLCPFNANREWLNNDEGRKQVVDSFRRAEVLSAQVVVFREAVAAVSFMLAGCARDYHDSHPCDWVHSLVSRKGIFGLGSRREYMCLFSAGFQRGLEASPQLRSFQLKALRQLLDALPQGETRDSLDAAIDLDPPSTDVGITRLLGNGGVFVRLDAIQNPLPASFYDRWDGSYDRIRSTKSPFISELECQCATVWQELEMAAENMASHTAADAYWAIRRWSTQFTLHLGALLEGKSSFANELDEFTELLVLLGKKAGDRTFEDKRRLNEIENLVEQVLSRRAGGNGVQLAQNVSVVGRWIELEMRPKVNASPASGSLTISVQFGNSHDSTTLAAPMYLWLKQRASGTMDPCCIPGDLLNEAMDAKSRALAKSNYANTKDISIIVEGQRETYVLTRIDGEVNVDVKN